MNTMTNFEVFHAQKNKASVIVYDATVPHEGEEIIIQGRLCVVDKVKHVSYTGHTSILHVTVLDYTGEI